MGPDPAMFRALIERCPLVAYVSDADNRITYISPQIEAWTGVPAERWTQEIWHRRLHPDDRDRVLAAEFGTGTMDIEYRMEGRDGAWIWVWEIEAQVPGQSGSQGICMDITALREAREELEAAQARLTAVVNAAPVILFAADAEGTITLSEGKALGSLGLAPGEMLGRSICDGPAAGSALQRDARRALSGESFDSHGEIAGNIYDCSWQAQEDGSIMGIAIDVTERHRSEERLAHLAFHDRLTALPNRATVEEHLDRELARAQRDGTTVATLYVDLDHFKLVNDSLGHAAGDQVLVQVARRIRDVTRAGDLLARLGGDEFMLVCPGIEAPGAEAVAAKVLAALADGLGMDVVAEGIETAEQLSFAAAAGYRFGQGFYFSRPLPAAELAPLLTSSRAPTRPAARASARSFAA